MRRKCNKCGGKGSYRMGLPVLCSRCRGTGMMDRVTKREKRERKLAIYCVIRE